MSRRSIANGLRDEVPHPDAHSTPAARVEQALELGRRDLALYAAQSGIGVAAARREIERRRQSGRRPSAAIAALLA